MNTHLHFDFSAADGISNCCGLARNVAVYIKQFKVKLDNLYITASNYNYHCYTLYDMKMNNTEISDVYVDLTGSGIENLDKYDSATLAADKGIACLYRLDSGLMNGASAGFNGGLRNVYVVTGKSFMPLGCGYDANGTSLYVTYDGGKTIFLSV